jgi:hypothetical protein
LSIQERAEDLKGAAVDETPVRTRSMPTLAIALLALAGVLFIIGAFVPAATVELPTGSSTASLWDQDWEGIASLVLGIVLLLAAAWALWGRGNLRGPGIAIAVAGLAGAGLALYKMLTVKSEAIDGVAASLAAQQGVPVEATQPVAQQLFDSGQASVSIGIGLYLVLIAGILTIVGGVMLAMRTSPKGVGSTPSGTV